MDLKLDNIGLGVVAERFEDELAKLVNNVIDPNTEAGKARELTIKLKVKPDKENREMCALEVQVSSKLAPTHAHVSRMAVGVNPQTGEVNAQEFSTGNLFESPATSTKIQNIKEA